MKRKYRHYLPKGWTLGEVRKVIDYYDNQTDEEGADEIESSGAEDKAMMEVPWKLVPQVKKLIERHRAKTKTRRPNPRHAA